jgi:hypothetical protein
MAVSRFETRKQLVLDEANAISTSGHRPQLLPAPTGPELANLLRQYANARVQCGTAGNDFVRLQSLRTLDFSNAFAAGRVRDQRIIDVSLTENTRHHLGAVALNAASSGCLRIRRAFRKHGIQPFVVTIDVIEKVHSTVFLRDGGYVENKDRDLHRQVNLPIVFARVHR